MTDNADYAVAPAGYQTLEDFKAELLSVMLDESASSNNPIFASKKARVEAVREAVRLGREDQSGNLDLVRSAVELTKRLMEETLHSQLAAGQIEAIGFDTVVGKTFVVSPETWLRSDAREFLENERVPLPTSSRHTGPFFVRLAQTVKAGTSTPSNRPTINKGGNPGKYDWEAFLIEIVRIADTDGLPVRDELQRAMMQWCTDNWDECPSDSLVRAKLKRLYDQIGGYA